MSRDLQLLGRAKRTHDGYLREIRKLAGYFNQSPDKLSQRQVADYLLHLINDRNFAPGSLKVAYSALKFFYTTTCPRDWTILDKLKVPKQTTLPFKDADSNAWYGQWTVDVQAVGDGRAVLKYLAPYINRVAIYLGWCWLMKKQETVEPLIPTSIPCNRCGVGTMHLTEITNGDGAVIYRKPLREHSVAYLDSG